MIDLTPLEVRKKKGDFRRVMRGYEPGLVDDFLDLAADRMEELVRDNLQLGERVRRLEEQVSDFRDRERALTEALVTAQEMREEMREQTSREAEIARREAESEAARIRQAAELARERAEESIRHLRDRQRQLVASYRALLERELAEISAVARSLEEGGSHRAIGTLFSNEDLEGVFAVADEIADPRSEAAAEAEPGSLPLVAGALRTAAEPVASPPPRPAAASPSPPAAERPALSPKAFRFMFEEDSA
jgi:cell division initiation protein